MKTPALLGVLAVVSSFELYWMASGAEAGKTFQADHVTVTYEGISDAYGRAVGQTVAAARRVAAEQFGFDLPQTVFVSVKAGENERSKLYNDGQDHIFLTVPSEASLRRPAATGMFHLYGFCHEIGHLAMYRVIPNRAWLSSGGAEGWAHYAGSRVLDAVYAREGEQLWPDAYDYRADGMARLRKQLSAPKLESNTRAAGLWMELAEIIGDKGLAPLFSAWGRLQVDEASPGAALGKVLTAQGYKTRLESWWSRAQPVLVETRARSDFAKQNPGRTRPLGTPKELAHDDGASAGKRSLAGSGHAVRFEAPGKDFLTAVRFFGSRYGQATPPSENAHAWLCDSDFKLIAPFPFPYSSLARGEPKWVTIPIKPTRVPERFIVCVGFNPTATKGFFVHHDNTAGTNSLTGLPGRPGQPFEKGNWLIRAVIQEAGD